jgi:hypothetical protein
LNTFRLLSMNPGYFIFILRHSMIKPNCIASYSSNA